MDKISATTFVKTPGNVIDLALRNGCIAITRRRRVVALLSREAIPLPDEISSLVLTASALLATLSAALDHTAADTHAYTITRHGRPVAWLLPRRLLRDLALEI